jgi:hypothetical protein
MRAASASSVLASIHRRLAGGNHKNLAIRSRCFRIPRRKSFAVTMCCIPGQGQKARTLHDPPSF